MKKIALVLLSVCALGFSTVAHAGSFSLTGIGDKVLSPGAVGVIDIVYNPAPEGVTFANGGVGLMLTSGTPGVIKFTGATIANPGNAWSPATVIVGGVSDNAIAQLNASSVGTPGLPSSGLTTFATINYEVLGPGTTNLSLGVQGEDPLYDGAQGDVSGIVALNGGPLTVIVPEPTTMALAGLSLVGLVLRRRNG